MEWIVLCKSKEYIEIHGQQFSGQQFSGQQVNGQRINIPTINGRGSERDYLVVVSWL
jgi:hypothetical protein